MHAKDLNELTAVDKQRIRKEQRHLEEFELMKKAAADAKQNSSINKKLVLNQFHGGVSNHFGNDTMAGTKPFLGTIAHGTMSSNGGTMSSDGFDANNRTMEASSRSDTSMKAAQIMPQNPHTE